MLSVGQANYGHPHVEVLRHLHPLSTHIYCTERNKKNSRTVGHYGDGQGGAGGFCKSYGAECPKKLEQDFGHLIVTLKSSQSGENTAYEGRSYCPVDWPTETS